MTLIHGIPDAGLKVLKFEEGKVEITDKVLFEEMVKDTDNILKKYNEMYDQEIIKKINDDTLAEQEVDIEVKEGNEVNGQENVSDEHFSKEEIAILNRVIKEEIDADKSYLEKAELVENEAIADMFRCIAKEEVQHQVLLENLAKGEFYTREIPIQTRTVVIDSHEISENDKMYIEILMQEEQDAMKSYAEAVQLSKSQILQENFVEIGNDEKEHFARLGKALHGEIEVEDLANEVVDLIEDGIKVDVVNKHYNDIDNLTNDVNFNQELKEENLKETLDEIININKEKGEGEGMAIKKEFDEKVVAESIKEEAPTNSKAQNNKEDIKEKNNNEKVVEEEKVEEEVKEESSEEEKVENSCNKEMEGCNKEMEGCNKKMEDDEEDDDDDEEDDNKEDEKMSKADKKTYEARIATLTQNIKILKAELEVAEPYKALYEAEVEKVKKLEAYKEDVELDRLRTDKVNYAKTCNFDALEDEDKDVVQEKIDDYKFSLYDFKAFMADVLKKYSKKQVYCDMEKVISYFSINDNKTSDEDITMPSDKNMADRILDKYSDAID